jgi:hypothetical protein
MPTTPPARQPVEGLGSIPRLLVATRHRTCPSTRRVASERASGRIIMHHPLFGMQNRMFEAVPDTPIDATWPIREWPPAGPGQLMRVAASTVLSEAALPQLVTS